MLEEGNGKRRVCIFCERWESGGIESFLRNVLNHADISELDIDIVAAEIKESVFTKPLQELGVRFVELSGNQRKLASNYRKFRKLLNERKYDAVHVNAFQALSLYYLYLAQQAGVPVRIAHSHNTALRKSLAKELKLFVHRRARIKFTRFSTELWACSKAAAMFLFSPKELEKRGFRFIPNGIDTDRFRFDPGVRLQIRNELHVNDRWVIGSVGRLCEQKNQSFLMDVFAEIKKRRKDSVLLLVGEGSDRHMLEEKAACLKISDSVIFYGTSDKVERLLWAMDVFVLPSLFEGLPVSLVEAQAAGLPVVCSDGITDEAYLTEPLKALDLNAGAAAWAGQISGLGLGERAAYAEYISKAGFDIRDVAQLVKAGWMGRSYG